MKPASFRSPFASEEVRCGRVSRNVALGEHDVPRTADSLFWGASGLHGKSGTSDRVESCPTFPREIPAMARPDSKPDAAELPEHTMGNPTDAGIGASIAEHRT